MDMLASFLALTPLERMRKKKEFQSLLFAAVEDGVLTEEEMEELERRKDEYGLTADDIRPIRAQLYMHAFEAVAVDKNVTEQEWTEMLKIQKFLGIEDPEVARTKKELLRLHIMREAKEGNVPVLHIKTLALSRGENAHWLEKGSVRTGKKDSPAELVLTNKRVVIRGSEASVIRLSMIVDIERTPEAIRLTKTSGEHVVFLPSDSKNVPIVATLLRTLIEARQ